ncbi:MAG: DoxX family protein [Hyphomicrobiaceae bacterium]|nr:DoxX family protein [Hyphomicrobiaceae bacterium]
MTAYAAYLAPIGRVLLAFIFILAGVQKITGYAGTAGYMEAFGVPGILLPLVIATELGLGLMLAVGFKARLAALGLAGFSLIAGLLFHFNPADQMQTILLLKNIAIAGGLLTVVAHGPGILALDNNTSRSLATA